MKSKSVAICLGILAIMAWGFYPLSAQQQVNPLYGPLLTPRQPNTGAQPYGLTPQTVPQDRGNYLQGMRRMSRSDPGSSDLLQRSRRDCRWVAAQPRFDLPNQPRITPVERLWPGSPGTAGIQETKSFQVKKSQNRDSTSGQSSRSGRMPQLPGQSPEQFFDGPLSAIEVGYQQLPNFVGESNKELRQYGYSLFASPISTFAPVTDVPVGPDYILGPGDDMIINVWGAMQSAVVQTVDRNGQIILPSVGPVRVWGLTFSQAEQLIRKQLSRSYRGFHASVTMGRLRAIRVYVVGEVCQPGSFTLSSLSTVTNALFAAGGPLKMGSLRNVQLKRNHHDVGVVDFYDFLLRGDKTRDFRLESGDTIFIPPIGPIAAIAGEIKRPAIYELKGPTRVNDLIEMAGGLTPLSYLKRVQVIRAKPNAEREVIDLDLTSHQGNGGSPVNIELRNGDLVRIYPIDPRVYNTVSVSGAVKHPGEYELKPGMRLSQILPREGTLPEAYLDRVEIARLTDDLTTEVIQVNLKQAWTGDQSQDISLRRRDRITVRSEYRSPWTVTLTGEVKRPGTYTAYHGERLSSVLKRAGGFTDKAFLKGAVFTRESVRQVEEKKLKDFVRDHEQRLLSEASQLTLASTGVSIEDVTAQQAVLIQRREQLKMLASKVTLGRVVFQLDELDTFTGSSHDLLLADGDSLKVPQRPATVLVMGSVRNPTGILHQEGMDIQYYLNRAGGLSPEADQKGIYMLKTDGSAITGFMKLRDIEEGDVIVVPPSTEGKTLWLPLIKDLATIAGQVAIGLAGLAAIF
ncbi:MAG: SLBB domain-containing protein [Deltaproteobacteria bacterium]|nr:SLBB domain-containing protein [Deltaproteobacteria bacterium]